MGSIVIIVLALVATDLIIDSIILKRMGYTVTGVLRGTWGRLKARFLPPVPAKITSTMDVRDDEFDDYECPCDHCRDTQS